MKKILFLILAALLIGNANAQTPIGVAFTNQTHCGLDVTIHAEDGSKGCNSYTTVAFYAPPGQITTLPWNTLNNSLLWGGGIVPDFNTIIIDAFCVDFNVIACSGNPGCVGDQNCGWQALNTIGNTCSCNGNATVNLTTAINLLGANWYYEVKMTE